MNRMLIVPGNNGPRVNNLLHLKLILFLLFHIGRIARVVFHYYTASWL